MYKILDVDLELGSEENELANQQEHMAFAGNCDKCFFPVSGKRVLIVIAAVTTFSVLFNLSRWFELKAMPKEVRRLSCPENLTFPKAECEQQCPCLVVVIFCLFISI